jgi:hypothetical protein
MNPPLRHACAWCIAFAALVASVPAWAGASTLNECLEAADFIGNAARSRDNGLPREAFIGRLEDDLVVIRAFPPSMRWFAKDADDERFLLRAAARVYDVPLTPAQHHAEFLAACLERTAA